MNLVKFSISNTRGSTATESGFTLIELLVVIAIIGVLASFFVGSMSSVQQRGRDQRRRSDLRQVQTALELYKQTNGGYPHSGWTTMWDFSTLASLLTAGTNPFIKTVPLDPSRQESSCPVYVYVTNPPNYTMYSLYASLENDSDSDAKKSKDEPLIKTGCTTDATSPANTCKTVQLSGPDGCSGAIKGVYNFWVNSPK